MPVMRKDRMLPLVDLLAQVLRPLAAAPERLARPQQELCIEAAAVLGSTLQVEASTFMAVAEGERWSREERQLLAFCVQHRQQWLDALRQTATLLNSAADGGPGGIQSWEDAGTGAGVAASFTAAIGVPPQTALRGRGGIDLICGALNAAKGAGVLISCLHASPPVRQLVPAEQPPLAATPEGAAAVVEVSELLVRLAAKRAGLHAVLESRLHTHVKPAMLTLLSRAEAVEPLLAGVTGLLREDALKAPVLVGANGRPGEAEAQLRAVAASVHSLAASAAKLVRLMPNVPAVETRIGGRHHYAQHVLELAVALCLRLLSLHPQLLPGHTENLTGHLRWACP